MRIKLFGATIFESEKDVPVINKPKNIQPTAIFETGISRRVYAMPFNGEKNLGEMGPIRRYILDHEALRYRSWQLYLESEICQTVIKRFGRWVIGKGLKLQAEPQVDVLESEGIKIEAEEFNKLVESRFKIYANSKMADYSNGQNLHKLAKTAHKNALLGGDVLVLLRYIDGVVKVQLIDGAHVGTPLNMKFSGVNFIADNGNRVKLGIELDAQNQHVAYYVRTTNAIPYVYERIPARGGKSSSLMAFMVYGLEYRLDNIRGIPLLSAVMETAKKMERYKEATLGSAEEVAKVSYAIEHDAISTGENPLLERAAQAYDVDNTSNSDIAYDINGKTLAANVMVSTNKQAINLTPGTKLVTLANDNELYFRDFFTVNIDLVCATVDIPPNVAMSKYDSNFSASRAALKDWEHTLDDERKSFSDQFYVPIYIFWLETQILTNKIQAPGYIQAGNDKNNMAIEAYRHARFVGAKVPHIDPEKEVRAERLKLGELGQYTPLTTNEAATENVSEGDYDSNMNQFAREIKEAKTAGLEPPAIADPNNPLKPEKIPE